MLVGTCRNLQTDGSAEKVRLILFELGGELADDSGAEHVCHVQFEYG